MRFLGKAILFLGKAKTDRCSLINALFFPTNFHPLAKNQTSPIQNHGKLRGIIH